MPKKKPSEKKTELTSDKNDMGTRRGNNTATIVIAVIALIVIAAVLIFFFQGHPNTNSSAAAPCPEIPKELHGEEEKKALDIQGQLEAAIKVKGDAAAKYDTVVHDNFAKLSDRNMTLVIFLRAVDCCLQHGDKEGAHTMQDILRAELARSEQHGDLSGPLTPEEIAEIRKSPYADFILRRFSSVP